MIREFIAWYAREHDLERLKSAIQQLPAAAQAAFDFERDSLGVLPSAWFDAVDVHRVLDRLTEGLPPRACEGLARDAGRATVQALMTGVQKAIFSKFMTPGAYAKLASVAFRMNYDAGSVVNHELGPKRHRGVVEGWTAHHPFLCRMHVAIKVEIYAAMGCKNVQIEKRYCRSDGDAECGSVIVWQ